jgi:hypothetical protein
MPTPTTESFVISVPEESHEDLAKAIEEECADHASLNSDRRSGKSVNSDQTEIEFKVEEDDQIRITVVKNPHKLPISSLKRKAERRVAELLEG